MFFFYIFAIYVLLNSKNEHNMAAVKQGKSKEVARKLNHFSCDVRAEAVVSELISSGIDADAIEIIYDSSHKKNWDKDILNVETKGGKILLRLSRDGFIHSLPEYLFLRPLEGSSDDIKKIIEFNKRQTDNARVLFYPIENELFRKGVDFESFENTLIASLNSGDNASIKEFWQIDNRIDTIDQVKLCKLIPNLHAIVGDFPLTAKCLEYFLEAQVSWKLDERMKSSFTNDHGPDVESSMGNYTCGDNMITSGNPIEAVSTLVFTIGPISCDCIKFYLENGKKRNMIDYFISYFIPLQYEVDININVSADDSDFSLDNSYLGLNSACNS
jgi:hypothetical protein